MLRRTQKLEKHQRLAMEAKQEARKERRATQRAETTRSAETVELGTNAKGEVYKHKKKTIKDIDDIGVLVDLKAESISRGKKQRINKKLAVLQGIEPEKKTEPNTVKLDAKKKVEKILKKRDEKLADKQQRGKTSYTEDDKELIKQAKNKKREKRRDKVKTEDEFDALFKSYEQRLIKKLNLGEDKNEKGAPFEEIDVSD